jgi:hypothetical protein
MADIFHGVDTGQGEKGIQTHEPEIKVSRAAPTELLCRKRLSLADSHVQVERMDAGNARTVTQYRRCQQKVAKGAWWYLPGTFKGGLRPANFEPSVFCLRLVLGRSRTIRSSDEAPTRPASSAHPAAVHLGSSPGLTATAQVHLCVLAPKMK